MSNPVLVICPSDTWTKVATNVTTGQVKRISKRPNLYLETYRMTENDPPTGKIEGSLMFENSNSEPILAASGIDVYVMAVGRDGKVRVDI